uniref:BTB domain-containing protein n=1 Tax=Acrobeloides nanus TaxID=290746 RepID=A0A914C9G7_9BILA
MSEPNDISSEATGGGENRSCSHLSHVRNANNRQKKTQHSSVNDDSESPGRPTSLFGSSFDQGPLQRDNASSSEQSNKINVGEPEYLLCDEFTSAAISRIGSKTEGTIKLNISNLCTLRQKVTTSFHTIANLPWRLAAKTECTKRTSNAKYFSIYIDCNPESESTLWSCEALVEFRLISQKHGCPDFTRQFSNKFSYNSNNWGFPSFMEWSEIINPEKGFIRSDRVVVEAHIIVQKVVGVRKNPTFEFTTYQPHVSDGILVIDGVRLHISKAYLALYSPVFHALFFSKFSEREMKEIPVEDVIYEEFVELLNVVYPSHKPITADNVEFLLELGDKFEIQYVLDACEQFLQTTNEIQVVTKLVWADQYSLAKLQ